MKLIALITSLEVLWQRQIFREIRKPIDVISCTLYEINYYILYLIRLKTSVLLRIQIKITSF